MKGEGGRRWEVTEYEHPQRCTPVLVGECEHLVVESDGLIGAVAQVRVDVHPVLVFGVLDTAAEVNVNSVGGGGLHLGGREGGVPVCVCVCVCVLARVELAWLLVRLLQ